MASGRVTAIITLLLCHELCLTDCFTCYSTLIPVCPLELFFIKSMANLIISCRFYLFALLWHCTIFLKTVEKYCPCLRAQMPNRCNGM